MPIASSGLGQSDQLVEWRMRWFECISVLSIRSCRSNFTNNSETTLKDVTDRAGCLVSNKFKADERLLIKFIQSILNFLKSVILNASSLLCGSPVSTRVIIYRYCSRQQNTFAIPASSKTFFSAFSPSLFTECGRPFWLDLPTAAPSSLSAKQNISMIFLDSPSLLFFQVLPFL
jgi:hypothetical protein